MLDEYRGAVCLRSWRPEKRVIIQPRQRALGQRQVAFELVSETRDGRIDRSPPSDLVAGSSTLCEFWSKVERSPLPPQGGPGRGNSCSSGQPQHRSRTCGATTFPARLPSPGACLTTTWVRDGTQGALGPVTDVGDGTYTATLTSSTTAGTATVTGTLDGLAIGGNATVAFVAGAASITTSQITAVPTSITADGATTSAITVQLQDVNGNPLTASGGVVALATTLGTLSVVTDVGDGSYTATLTSSASAGTATVTGTLDLVAITDNEMVVFAAGAASTATSQITALPTSITADGVSASVVTVQLQDTNGNPLTSSGGTVALATTSGTLGPVTDVGDGTSTATLTSSTTAGTATLTGTLDGNAITDTEAVQLVAGTGMQLAITTQPVGGASGAALATQPVVLVQDAEGNTVTTDNTTQVTVAILSGVGGTLSGTTMVAAVGGIVTFANLTLAGTVAENYALQFTAIGLTTANSGNVNVMPGAATQLAITTQPVGGASGAALPTQPVILVQDAEGNTVTTDNTTQVTVAIQSGAGGTLGGTTTVTAASGVVTFANVTLAGTVGVNYVLRFTATGLTLADSGNVTVTAGAATQLAITTQPVGGASGAALPTQPVVLVQDAEGNTVLTDNATQVTFAIQSGAGGTLGGTTTVTAASGVVTFAGVTLAGTIGVNYVLRFTATGLTLADSNNVTVTAGAATQLAITTQPVGGASGAALPTQPVVLVQDAEGNTVTTDNTTQVTVAIQSGAGGTLGGTTTVTAASGVVTFAGVTLAGTIGVNYVLRFTATGLTLADSNNVTVTAGAATQLAITTQPVGGASGDPLGTQPVVEVQDAEGNTVTTDNTTQVTVAIQSGAGGTVGGTTTVTAVSGVVTFANVTLAGTIGVNYVLRFTATGLTLADSNNVTVSVGAAAQLAITTQPVGGASGAVLATQPVVLVQDAEGNTVTTDNTTQVTVAIQSGAGGTLGGTTTVTAASGVVTFAGVTLAGTVGVNYVLRFTATGLTLADSNNVTVTAGAPALIVLTGPATVVAGVASTNFTLEVQDAQNNPTNTTQAEMFDLTSTSAGTVTFNPVSPVTVALGTSSVTFTYTDTEVALQTVTATWSTGAGTNLGNDTHQINVTP